MKLFCFQQKPMSPVEQPTAVSGEDQNSKQTAENLERQDVQPKETSQGGGEVTAEPATPRKVVFCFVEKFTLCTL